MINTDELSDSDFVREFKIIQPICDETSQHNNRVEHIACSLESKDNEILEQCRLNAMGADREDRLMDTKEDEAELVILNFLERMINDQASKISRYEKALKDIQMYATFSCVLRFRLLGESTNRYQAWLALSSCIREYPD